MEVAAGVAVSSSGAESQNGITRCPNSERNERLLYKLNKLLEDRNAVHREVREISHHKFSEWLVERRRVAAEYIYNSSRVIGSTLQEIFAIDANMTNSNGETVLHLAAAVGDAELVSQLLKDVYNDRGLDITRRNRNGKTALEVGFELSMGDHADHVKQSLWSLVLGYLHRDSCSIPRDVLIHHSLLTNNPFLLSIVLTFAVFKEWHLETLQLDRYHSEDPLLKELLRWGQEQVDLQCSDVDVICTPWCSWIMKIRYDFVSVAKYLIQQKGMYCMMHIIFQRLHEYRLSQLG